MWFLWWLDGSPAVIVRCSEPTWNEIWQEAFDGEHQYCIPGPYIENPYVVAHFIKANCWFWRFAPIVFVTHWPCDDWALYRPKMTEADVCSYGDEVARELNGGEEMQAFHLHLSTTGAGFDVDCIAECWWPFQIADALAVSKALRKKELLPAESAVITVVRITDKPTVEQDQDVIPIWYDAMVGRHFDTVSRWVGKFGDTAEIEFDSRIPWETCHGLDEALYGRGSEGWSNPAS